MGAARTACSGRPEGARGHGGQGEGWRQARSCSRRTLRPLRAAHSPAAGCWLRLSHLATERGCWVRGEASELQAQPGQLRRPTAPSRGFRPPAGPGRSPSLPEARGTRGGSVSHGPCSFTRLPPQNSPEYLLLGFPFHTRSCITGL